MPPQNFGRTRVVVAPTPATSGLGFTVTDGTGALRLGSGPVVLAPHGTAPEDLADVAEVAYVQSVAGDTVTLRERAIEGSTARSVAAGWDVIQGATAAMWQDASPDAVAALYDQDQFFIAHRGCGDEAPENTLVAFRQAISRGHQAIEVSSQATVDGVPVVMHDATLDRTTSLTGNLAIKSLSQLSALIVDYGTSFLGSGWSANLPVPTTGEVLALAKEAGRAVLLEPKSDADRTLTVATGFGGDIGKWIVWKFNRSSNGSLPSHAVNARAAGLPLWVYMTVGDSTSLIDTVIATLRPGDAIGVDTDETSDATISHMVTAAAAAGVKVIGFVVRQRYQRDRLAALGVTGFMCTSVSYLSNDDAAFTTDGFSGAVRRPGEYEGASNKLLPSNAFDTTAPGSVTLAQGTTATLHMGSMSPVAQADGLLGGYRIDGEIRWSAVDGSTAHSDLYIGHESDTPYAHQGTTNEPGYSLMFGMDGRMRIFTHVNGSATLTQQGSTVATTPPSANTWYPFRVTVTDTQVSWQRMSDVTTATVATHGLYRGGHWGLASASTSVAAQFRSLVVTAL